MIRAEVTLQAGVDAKVRLFGSRADNTLRGGDVDLLVECNDSVDDPALLSARLSARISIAMGGRKVDVILKAPNLLELPIHAIAREKGILL